MRRGELYLISNPPGSDPKRRRVYVIVSRQQLIDSGFSSVICAPVYSQHDGLLTQVAVGVEEGLKHESSIHCDELMSVPKSRLTNYVGSLSPAKLIELAAALKEAIGVEDDEI